jgi:hypothetical protein
VSGAGCDVVVDGGGGGGGGGNKTADTRDPADMVAEDGAVCTTAGALSVAAAIGLERPGPAGGAPWKPSPAVRMP